MRGATLSSSFEEQWGKDLLDQDHPQGLLVVQRPCTSLDWLRGPSTGRRAVGCLCSWLSGDRHTSLLLLGHLLLPTFVDALGIAHPCKLPFRTTERTQGAGYLSGVCPPLTPCGISGKSFPPSAFVLVFTTWGWIQGLLDSQLNCCPSSALLFLNKVLLAHSKPTVYIPSVAASSLPRRSE